MAARTILVAEDEIIVQKVIKAAIEHKGYVCEVVSDGTACLERLARAPVPELLLLDLVMPQVGGIEVLERLKGIPAAERFPIVVLTGKSDVPIVKQAFQLGADDYVVKPFDVKVLTERLDDLLFTAGEARIRELLANLRIQDPSLTAQLAQIGAIGKELDAYPSTLDNRALAIAVPRGKAPHALAKVPLTEIVTTIGIFHRCASGWRKVWPRFAPPAPAPLTSTR
jgi:CheY-like chemotaxis protein